jgi:pyruvate dehydrogenase E2 component (dihydrolipoamide acetyltransferase)
LSSFADQIGALPPFNPTDHSKFGPVEVLPLSKRQRLGGSFLTRNALAIPHVTHHDDIDITALEEWRRSWNARHAQRKLTLLPFLVAAVCRALTIHLKFNSSLDASGDNLVLKKYYNIGVAVDTDDGLLVPVIHGCEARSVVEIAREIDALAAKARASGLSLAQMSGGCFTLSSLGHVGGTGFTPIINAPEVAILGICRARAQPTLVEGRLFNRVLLPVSLSYDHRAINGVDAARFARTLEVNLGPDHFLDESIGR